MANKEPKQKEQMDFDGQRDGEKVLFVFRRHIIAMRKGFYLFLGTFLIASLPTLIVGPTSSYETMLSFLKIAGLGFLLGLFLFIYHFILWYFSIYIVTDQRIRQVTQRKFFGKDVIDLNLSKIQNISYNIPGFSGEIFKFGTIVIQTFVGDLVIKNVEHPDKIYNKLQKAVSRLDNSKEAYEEIN